MRIFFVNRTSNPIFEVQEFETDFTENEKGMEEVRVIPNAVDPKLYEIYYFIDRKFIYKNHSCKIENVLF